MVQPEILNRNVVGHKSTDLSLDQIQAEARDFYARQAGVFAKILNESWSEYTNISHPGFKNDLDLIRQVKQFIAPGAKGIDAGCGPLAREVFCFYEDGYDMYGMDVVPENIQTALEYHPSLADRLFLADLTQPLDFPDNSFDFIICNTVIQHINLNSLTNVTFPEWTRILKPGGIIQLMFRSGHGTQTIQDVEFNDQRSFYLYQPQEILEILARYGLSLIPEENGNLGGIIYVTDVRPMENCIFCVRKTHD
jgi:SAM-dependent methyltransferase